MATDAVPVDLLRSFFDGLKQRFQAMTNPLSPIKAWMVCVHSQSTAAFALDLDGIPCFGNEYHEPAINYLIPGLQSAESRGERVSAVGRTVPYFQRHVAYRCHQAGVQLRLTPVGDDAARLLEALPAAVQSRLWSGLPTGTQLGAGVGLWALAVFELANAGWPLRAVRQTPPQLKRPGNLFSLSPGELVLVPKLVGTPQLPFDWYATLPDFAAASVQAIDILQSWLADVPKQAAKATSEPPKPVAIPKSEGTPVDEDAAKAARYAALLQAVKALANDVLVGKQCRVVELLVEAGGRKRIADVATDTGVGWDKPYKTGVDGFKKGIKTRFTRLGAAIMVKNQELRIVLADDVPKPRRRTKKMSARKARPPKKAAPPTRRQ